MINDNYVSACYAYATYGFVNAKCAGCNCRRSSNFRVLKDQPVPIFRIDAALRLSRIGKNQKEDTNYES